MSAEFPMKASSSSAKGTHWCATTAAQDKRWSQGQMHFTLRFRTHGRLLLRGEEWKLKVDMSALVKHKPALRLGTLQWWSGHLGRRPLREQTDLSGLDTVSVQACVMGWISFSIWAGEKQHKGCFSLEKNSKRRVWFDFDH